MTETHTDKGHTSVTHSQESAAWADLWWWLLFLTFHLSSYLTRPKTNDNVYWDIPVIEQMALPHTQPTVGLFIQCLLKCQQSLVCSVVLGSEMPRETQETDIPLRWRNNGVEMNCVTRGGHGDEEKWKTEQRQGRGAGDKKRRLALNWQVKWCVGLREMREEWEERGRLIDREEQDVRGGGAHTEFELIRQQNLSPVRFWAVSSSNVCVCVCVCVTMQVCGGGWGCWCLWREVRGDWWFTEERWWSIHLRKSWQSLWQHEWPVICHPAQRPPLSAGWEIHTPSASRPQASAHVSLNCEAVVRGS